MNSNCLGLRYSDCTRKIKGNSSKVSEPSILHLDRKLSTMFRLPHVFILPHDLFSTSLYPIKLTWTKIHRHFHPPDPVQSCLMSSHNFCAFAHSHSINCQQPLQSGVFCVSEGFYLWNI